MDAIEFEANGTKYTGRIVAELDDQGTYAIDATDPDGVAVAATLTDYEDGPRYDLVADGTAVAGLDGKTYVAKSGSWIDRETIRLDEADFDLIGPIYHQGREVAGIVCTAEGFEDLDLNAIVAWERLTPAQQDAARRNREHLYDLRD